jgi:hypothetical protein
MGKFGSKASGLDGRHHDRNGTTLGLKAFEKISAIEGVRLSREMRRDVRAITEPKISGAERTRFITDKYGKK